MLFFVDGYLVVRVREWKLFMRGFYVLGMEMFYRIFVYILLIGIWVYLIFRKVGKCYLVL